MSLGERIAIAALAAAVVAIAMSAWLLFAVSIPGDATDDPFDLLSEAPSASSSRGWADTVVVDVEGGVLRPGIVRLDGGARVADAIAAAGGYSRTADLAAAAAQINLASPLRDGQQVLVPALGGSTPDPGAGTDTGGDLVDLNHASAEALDALPGIGPVTVQKIVAARTDKPFATLDELITRKVLTSSQLEGIRDLVTVG